MISKDKYMSIRSENIECFAHINPELEVVYVKRGTITLIYDMEPIILNDGDAMIILPYHLHEFHQSEKSETYVFMFSYSLAHDFCCSYSSSEVNSNSFKINGECSAYIEQTINLTNSSRNSSFEKSLFYMFIGLYTKSNPVILHCNNKSVFINRAIEYIYSRIEDNITLSETANALCVNKSTLSLEFRNLLGISFNEFINNIRIQKALSLFHTTDISVTEASYMSGFGSLRNFNRVFTKKMHCTPSEYKRSII